MIKEKLIRTLNETKEIIKYGDVSLKSGDNSNVYVDLKKAYGDPFLFELICQNLDGKISSLKEEFNVIAVSGIGGIPLGIYFSQKYGKKLTMIRESIKTHGTKELIEGYSPNKQDKIIILDDVFTKGTSMKNTIKALESTQVEIIRAVVCIKRGENTLEIPLDYVLTLKDLVSKDD